MPLTPRGLVAVPAFNEEESIGRFLAELVERWPREDIVVVNDGSRDGTRGIVTGHGISQLVHPTNLGYGAAIRTALLYAQRRGYDFLVLMDADGQHDPASLEALVHSLVEGRSALVIGSRMRTGEWRCSLIRRGAMRAFAFAIRVCTGMRLTDTTSGLKAIHSTVFDELICLEFVDFHSEVILYLALRGFGVTEVPVRMRSRFGGRSMHSWRSLASYPARTMFGMLVGAIEALGRARGTHDGK